LAARTQGIGFYSATYRLFKLATRRRQRPVADPGPLFLQGFGACCSGAPS